MFSFCLFPPVKLIRWIVTCMWWCLSVIFILYLKYRIFWQHFILLSMSWFIYLYKCESKVPSKTNTTERKIPVLLFCTEDVWVQKSSFLSLMFTSTCVEQLCVWIFQAKILLMYEKSFDFTCETFLGWIKLPPHIRQASVVILKKQLKT